MEKTTSCRFPECFRVPRYGRTLCPGHLTQHRRGKPLTPIPDFDARVEDAEEMLDRGDDPFTVAQALGTNVEALNRLLARRGRRRRELARAVGQLSRGRRLTPADSLY